MTMTPQQNNTEQAKVNNMVRQILMNEMGLTRDGIRDMVKEITTETVDKFFKTGQFERFLETKIEAQLESHQRTYNKKSLALKLSEMVGEAVKKEIMEAVQKQVANGLTVQVAAKYRSDGEILER